MIVSCPKTNVPTPETTMPPSLSTPTISTRQPPPPPPAKLDMTPLNCYYVGGPPWPSDAISIESNGISNRSNRNSQKNSNDRKIARMARILTIFGRNRSSRRNLSFQKFSNERKIIKSIESIDSIGRSIDRSYRSMAALITAALCRNSNTECKFPRLRIAACQIHQ